MSEHPLASVSDNPMLGEVRRHGRRFLNHGNRTINRVALGVIGVAYVGVLMLVMSAHGDVPAIGIIFLQTVLAVFMAPVSMQGLIAGEREKRTWDMLLVAPISRRDIVVGKFGASMFTLGIVVAAAVIPTVLTALLSTRSEWGVLAVSELLSFSLITMVSALTLFFSARSSRPIAALGATLATLTGVFVALPVSAVALLSRFPADKLLEALFYWHPILIWANLLSGDPAKVAAGFVQAIIMSAAYFGISSWLIRLAVRAVERIDPELGPVKRGRRA